MIDADLPCFEVGENAVNPGKHVMSQLFSNDLFIVFCPVEIVVRRESIGFDGAAVSNFALNKIMQGFCSVIRNFRQANTAWLTFLVMNFNFNRPGDHEFPLVTSPRTNLIIFGAATN